MYCVLCPGCAWLNWAVTGRVCQEVGGVSEVEVVGKGRKRESVQGRERRRREGGRKGGNREGRGRQASGGGSMSALTNLVRRSLRRHRWRCCKRKTCLATDLLKFTIQLRRHWVPQPQAPGSNVLTSLISRPRANGNDFPGSSSGSDDDSPCLNRVISH